MPGTAATQALPALSVQEPAVRHGQGFPALSHGVGTGCPCHRLVSPWATEAPSEVNGRQAGADSACTAHC